MITILVVGERDRAGSLDGLASRNPSLELLHATGVEDTLDRLARNRRIDAVLLLADPADARATAAAVLEEDPAAPPIFLARTPLGIPGVRFLTGTTPEELLESLAGELRAGES